MIGEEESKEFTPGCKRTCACSRQNCPNRRRMQKEKKCENQRTFISFICETISIIAFIIFGSIVFWCAVAGIFLDFFKKLYYSDRYVKLFAGILLSILLLSMTFQYVLNTRTDRKIVYSSKGKVTVDDAAAKGGIIQEIKKDEIINPPDPPPPPPSPEYMRITLKERHLEHLNGEAPVKNIDKKSFTLSITDEKKKEVFRTSRTVFIPELTMQEKRPPLIVVLKEILLEDY